MTLEQQKYTSEEVLKLILEVYRKYEIVPGAGFIAGVIKTTPQTIHRKLNDLEVQGMIVQIRKEKNIINYRLTKKAINKG